MTQFIDGFERRTDKPSPPASVI